MQPQFIPNVEAFFELIISVPHRQQDFAVNISVESQEAWIHNIECSEGWLIIC